MPTDLLNTLMLALQVLLALFGAFLAALQISLVVWTFRDMRSRSRDAFAHLLATALVFFFSVPGLLLYMILRPRETLADQYERALEEEALLQGFEERLVCPGCQRKTEPDFVVCPSCQTVLKTACANCGRLLHPKWVLCPYCATPVTPARPERRRARVSEAKAKAAGPARSANPLARLFRRGSTKGLEDSSPTPPEAVAYSTGGDTGEREAVLPEAGEVGTADVEERLSWQSVPPMRPEVLGDDGQGTEEEPQLEQELESVPEAEETIGQRANDSEG
jgi:hypothetical protein